MFQSQHWLREVVFTLAIFATINYLLSLMFIVGLPYIVFPSNALIAGGVTVLIVWFLHKRNSRLTGDSTAD